MRIKIMIIALIASMSSLALSSDYSVVVSKTHNKYEIGSGEVTPPEPPEPPESSGISKVTIFVERNDSYAMVRDLDFILKDGSSYSIPSFDSPVSKTLNETSIDGSLNITTTGVTAGNSYTGQNSLIDHKAPSWLAAGASGTITYNFTNPIELKGVKFESTGSVHTSYSSYTTCKEVVVKWYDVSDTLLGQKDYDINTCSGDVYDNVITLDF